MDGHRVTIVTAPPGSSGRDLLAALQLPATRGLVVVNGGTGRLPDHLEAALRAVLRDGVARPVAENDLALLTGGTNAGIFALLGQSLATAPSSPPRIGVVPDALVTWPGRTATTTQDRSATDPVPLEPHHSHFVVVQGNRWGDETPAMLEVAFALSESQPSIAILVNGGSVARQELLGHVRQRRPVVVLAGSGRLADEVAAALHGKNPTDDVVREIVRGRITVVGLDESPSMLAQLIHDRMGIRKEEA